MGTTIVLLFVVTDPSPVAHVAHVGDSRAYRLRSGALSPLTRDHTLIERYLERGFSRRTPHARIRNGTF